MLRKKQRKNKEKQKAKRKKNEEHCLNFGFVDSGDMATLLWIKPVFHQANLFARTDKKVGTLPTCSQRIFSPANFNQSRCRILVFASCRANKFAQWKTGFRAVFHFSCIIAERTVLYVSGILRQNYWHGRNRIRYVSLRQSG